MTQLTGLIAIGASLGGFIAVRTVLEGLPKDLGCGIVVAQHRANDPYSRLVDLLAKTCPLPLVEPEDKTRIEPNHVYLAPSDYHMLVEPGSVSLSVDPPLLYARPSIDILFESVADSYGAAAIGVILTGSNEDGASGATAIKKAGGRLVVQDPSTAQSPVAPLAVLAKTAVDEVVPVEEVASTIVKLIQRRRAATPPS